MMRRSDPESSVSFVESKERLRAALNLFEASVAKADTADTSDALDEVLAVHQAVKETASRLIAKQSLPESEFDVSPKSTLTASGNFAATTLDQERFTRAHSKILEDPDTKTLAARVPTFLDRYVEAWVSRSKGSRPRRREITKQEVITEALCMFYAAHPLPPVPDEEIT